MDNEGLQVECENISKRKRWKGKARAENTVPETHSIATAVPVNAVNTARQLLKGQPTLVEGITDSRAAGLSWQEEAKRRKAWWRNRSGARDVWSSMEDSSPGALQPLQDHD